MRLLPALTAVFVLCAATSTTVLAAEPKTEEEKALYALGVALSQSITTFNLTEQELEWVKSGVSDGAKGKTGNFDPQPYFPKLQEMQKIAAGRCRQGRARQGGRRERRQAHAVGPGVQADQGRHRSVAEGDRHGQGPLPRHACRTAACSTARYNAASRRRSR